jgi:uncharacterized protein YcfL
MTSTPFRRHSRVRSLPALALAAPAFAAGLAGLTVLTGCESTPPVSASDPVVIADPRLSVLDGVGRDLLRFQQAVVVDRPDQPLRVQVPVTNVSSRDTYYADYRYLFFDADGLQLEPVMGWQFIPFDPGQSQRMIGAAVHPTARSWRLEVRRAR